MLRINDNDKFTCTNFSIGISVECNITLTLITSWFIDTSMITTTIIIITLIDIYMLDSVRNCS